MTALRPLVRPLVALCLGLALPVACERAAARLRPPWRPGPPAVWVADRDAGRLVALDRELYVAGSAELVAPVAVEACPDGGAWALDAVERRPDGALALVRVDARGVVRAAVALARAPLVGATARSTGKGAAAETSGSTARPRAAPPDLAALADGSALVCVPEALAAAGAPARVLAVDPSGRVAAELRRPGARAVAGRGRTIVVGGADGSLAAFDRGLGHALVALGALDDPVLDVAPAPRGAWWVLTEVHGAGRRGGGAARRLWLVDGATLAPRWEAAVDLEVATLATPRSGRGLGAATASGPSGEAAVWLVSATRARARYQRAYRPAAGDVSGLPLGGFGAGAARTDGALYLPAPGALLELDAAGRLVRTQGGFDFLVGAACVP